jgi:hypothetical protein
LGAGVANGRRADRAVGRAASALAGFRRTDLVAQHRRFDAPKLAAGLEAELVEPAPVERHVLVQVRQQRAQLLGLDRRELVARRGVQPRPVPVVDRTLPRVPVLLDGVEPPPPCRVHR